LAPTFFHPALIGLSLLGSQPADPRPQPTLPWFAAQLVPSPELASGDDGFAFGMRWQITPLVYSFGLNRRLSPWRFFVVDPFARYSGSLELHYSPEYLALESRFRDRYVHRAGVRAYFPLVERGEYLSFSLGSSYFHTHVGEGAAYEIGAYVLFGYLGVQFAYAPGFDPARFITTLRIRVF
jgi:hypothetical protein